MKTIKQILESHNIKENTKYHNWSYVYESIVKAMIEFGEQSFDTGVSFGHYDGTSGSLWESEYEYDSFEDYLKQVNN